MVHKIMIIGLGGMGSSWAREIKKHDDWKLTGIVDTNTEMLENLNYELMGLEEDTGYMSIEECVQFGEKPDAVVVATPIYSHHSIAREALDLGINTISEKNMAGTIYQGKQMVQKALDNPTLCTALGTQYRYNVNSWTAKNFFLQNNKPDAEISIGKLGMIRWEDNGYRGESRWGWRRFLQDVYLEDMAVHWFDTIRYTTGMDIVQIQAQTFMPTYSSWHGSSEIYANFALAHPDDYNHRHNWVWVQLYGGWQGRGPTTSSQVFYGGKGQAKMSQWGMECKIYTNPKDSRIFEEDGMMPQQDVENLGTNYTGDGIILEQMKLGIESKGERQPGTNFPQAFRSFAVSMAARESSQTGKAVWVPDYWADMPWYKENPSKFY